MNSSFWRPVLIFALAVVLIGVFTQYIPALDNKILPLKKFDLLADLKAALLPTPDSLKAAAGELKVANATAPLEVFLQGLNELQKTQTGNLRIAYYGDSIIEGDLVSGTLRDRLQETYGGSGVGLVPITSVVNEFRRTISHHFSKNWETRSFMNGAGKGQLGVIGYTFIPQGHYYTETTVRSTVSSGSDSLAAAPKVTSRQVKNRQSAGAIAWVEYAGVDYPGGSTDFRRIRLFYSKASPTSYVDVSHDGGAKRRFPLSAADGINVLDVSPAAPIRKVRLEFNSNDPINVHGVSFDDINGVYVDNFSVRGYSGLNFDRIPATTLSAIQFALNYDLVIMQYGENVSSPDRTEYTKYKEGMIKAVRHIQYALPGVPILILSAHDRSIRKNGTMVTSPDIPILVNTQAELASETGCAFWNVFEAMGGLGSMPGWVSASPKLARSDYTHFTRAGASKIANLLYDVITTGKLD